MAVITDSQIAQYGYGAGFRGNALTIAVAVALAESGGNTAATNYNTNNTVDRGLWQINSVHSQYSGTLLFNPDYNARAAWDISSHGSNWNPWTTYKTGAYQRFMGRAQSVVGSPSLITPAAPKLTVDQVFTQKNLWKWYSSHVTNPFNGSSERGADYAAPWGTPVAAIMGGKVVRIEHNNNSIGDVVEVQASDTSVVLYQHIRTRVRTGQSVSTGDIIGTEDGLPVDQYSTGPHIECRYAPPGRYIFSNGSWNNGWINPVPFFSSIGRQFATGPINSGGVVPVLGAAGPLIQTSYLPLSEQVHETLINTPGFYGIALAIDEAEQFPGYVDLTQPQQTVNIGSPAVTTDVPIIGNQTLIPGQTLASFTPPDVTGIVRSIGATISDNFIPFAIRSGLVLMGFVLVVALVLKPVTDSAPEVLELLEVLAI